MADAIGQVLALAVGVSISPVPIIAVVLMLGTPRGRVNGPAFLGGWLIGLAALGTLVLVLSNVAGPGDGGDEPATWASWVKIALGLLLVGVAVRQWRGRPRAGEPAPLPGWMKTIAGFTPVRAGAMGLALSAINPKNLLLTVGAAEAIAASATSHGDEAVAMVVFVLVATIGPAVPVGISVVMGERARSTLAELEAWMGAHNAAIMSVLCLVIGAKLAGDGIAGLGS
jgi:threonine/homoserine/homoserine lactone efflux protein